MESTTFESRSGSTLNFRDAVRPILVLLVDGSIAATCFWIGMLLRFDGRITEYYRDLTPPLMLLIAGCRILANVGFKLHRWSFRYSGLTDGARIGMAGFTGSALFLACLSLAQFPGTPRSVVVLELLMSTLLMAAVRFAPRLTGLYVNDWTRRRSGSSARTLIVGAGSAGEMLLRDLQRSGSHGWHVVGFVDDDASKKGLIVGGVPVLGALDQLDRLARLHGVSDVLIAIPRLEGKRVREILTRSAELGLRFKILPASFIHDQSRGASAMMQNLSTDDLLMREPVTFAQPASGQQLADRRAVVTGAAGSIGSEIVVQLVRAGLRDVVLVDMNENGLYMLSQRLSREYPDAAVAVEVADVRDEGRILSLFRRYEPDDVFHAAAHKHVPLMETAPGEAIKNNVLGTLHVARAADAVGAERMLYISTDKAVRPTSVMGATKRVGEMIIRAMDRRSETRYCAVRFGNVLGSAGSVVPLFAEQIKSGGPVRVTDPEVRRYFMTIPEAVSLVLQSCYGDYGDLCVLDMGEPIKIVDLARQMITMAGLVPEVDVKIEYTGLRPGEKLFEELLTEHEEATRPVHAKILVAEPPAPPADLDAYLAELAEAASAERHDEVVEILRRLVPSYRRGAEAAARTA